MRNSMGARNKAITQRDINDYYATHPSAITTALPMLKKYNLSKKLIEPCCGCGHISETLKENGFLIKETPHNYCF